MHVQVTRAASIIWTKLITKIYLTCTLRHRTLDLDSSTISSAISDFTLSTYSKCLTAHDPSAKNYLQETFMRNRLIETKARESPLYKMIVKIVNY